MTRQSFRHLVAYAVALACLMVAYQHAVAEVASVSITVPAGEAALAVDPGCAGGGLLVAAVPTQSTGGAAERGCILGLLGAQEGATYEVQFRDVPPQIERLADAASVEADAFLQARIQSFPNHVGGAHHLLIVERGPDTQITVVQATDFDLTGGAPLPTLTFLTGDSQIPLAVEVADTGERDACGLMHRTFLPDDQGMLFAFGQDSLGPFYMRNTRIPLAVAFIAVDGTIVDIQEMAPTPIYPTPESLDLPNYYPAARYRYALEANGGWYARQGIKVGDRVAVDDLLAATQRGSRGLPPTLCSVLGL